MPIIAINRLADAECEPYTRSIKRATIGLYCQDRNKIIHNIPPPCYPPDMAIQPPARRAYAPARSNPRAAHNRLIHKALSAKSWANFEAKPIIHPVSGLLQGSASLRHTPISCTGSCAGGRTVGRFEDRRNEVSW